MYKEARSEQEPRHNKQRVRGIMRWRSNRANSSELGEGWGQQVCSMPILH